MVSLYIEHVMTIVILKMMLMWLERNKRWNI